MHLPANVPHAYLSGEEDEQRGLRIATGNVPARVPFPAVSLTPACAMRVAGECVEVMATSDNVVRAGCARSSFSPAAASPAPVFRPPRVLRVSLHSLRRRPSPSPGRRLTPKLRDTATLCSMLSYRQGPPDILRGEKRAGGPAGVLSYEPPFEEFALDAARLAAGEAAALDETPGPSVVLVASGAAKVASVGAGAGGTREERQAKAGEVLFLPARCGVVLSGEGEAGALVYRARVNPRAFAATGEA